ncbi:MAG TPA: thioredoxin fold domain-containing protein [Bacteroidota bacterium]|nr:thioredoxin fold domain-containing protein [Bacteroidota bacterium]
MTLNRTLLPVVLTAVLSIVPCFPQTAAGQKPASGTKAGLEWTNLESAVTTGADQKKAIMVDVYTDWCGWCKKMDKEVFADPAVSEILASRFALAKVNGESKESITYKGQKTDGVGIARGFGVRGYPSIIFLDSKGDMLTMIPGFMDAEKFLPVVMFIGNREYEKMEWEAYLASYTASKKTPQNPK